MHLGLETVVLEDLGVNIEPLGTTAGSLACGVYDHETGKADDLSDVGVEGFLLGLPRLNSPMMNLSPDLVEVDLGHGPQGNAQRKPS